VVVLLAEDTRDEAYFWKARQDEKRMQKELRLLKNAAGDIESRLRPQVALDDIPAEADAGDGESNTEAADSEQRSNETSDGQAGLDAFAGGSGATSDSDGAADSGDGGDGSESESGVATAGRDSDDVEVVIDQRELDAAIARDLSTREGVETRLETLAVGDYVCSDRVVVERKTVGDFLSTLTGGDRSLFEQVGDAARHYGRPVVIIEGEELYSRRNVHPKAINGALASLAVDFGASVLQTADEAETADLLEVLATREQETERREVSVHGEKQSKTLTEQQEYVVASVAEVGPVTARSLLAELGSVEAVMTADEEALMEAEGVGKVTARRIREVVASPYADS
jgi:Fanconi anemia group M protein